MPCESFIFSDKSVSDLGRAQSLHSGGFSLAAVVFPSQYRDRDARPTSENRDEIQLQEKKRGPPNLMVPSGLVFLRLYLKKSLKALKRA